MPLVGLRAWNRPRTLTLILDGDRVADESIPAADAGSITNIAASCVHAIIRTRLSVVEQDLASRALPDTGYCYHWTDIWTGLISKHKISLI
jgi:hypothetical protein